MRKKFSILLPLLFIACQNPNNNDQKNSHKHPGSKYYTQLDTITIPTDMGGPILYSKKSFNDLIDRHPEFFNSFLETPDKLYFCYGNNSEFSSEVGQDQYYTLYAYFLKQQNGLDKYAEQRKKLITIFSNINSIFGYVAYGGTYFTHQYTRIPAYVEYLVYLLSIDKEKENSPDKYNISQQRKLYIETLRQIIEDENKVDFESMGQEKVDRMKKMNLLIDEIEQLITNSYYLHSAQNFHFQYYQYY